MSVRFVSAPFQAPLKPTATQNQRPDLNPSVSFEHLIAKASGVIENLDQQLVASQLGLVTGNARDMHTAVLAAEKASLTLDLVVSVRNKAIEAYQEIMRMPL